MSKENSLFLEFKNTGNCKVFETLFRMTKPWLYKMIYRIVPNKATADDILQETWIQVLNCKDNYDCQKGLFNNFIYTVAKNRALKAKMYTSKFNSNNHNSDDIDTTIFGINELTPYITTEIRDKNDKIMLAIKSLDKNYQDVILLHYFAELEVKEISECLSKPEGTIKTWLARGRGQLKIKLQSTNSIYLPSLLFSLIFINISY